MTHQNISTTWPQLSAEQSAALLKNVRAFQNLTETANYPYHQAGMHADLVLYNVCRNMGHQKDCSALCFDAVEVWYSDKNRTRILRYDDVGDGAAWTGV